MENVYVSKDFNLFFKKYLLKTMDTFTKKTTSKNKK